MAILTRKLPSFTGTSPGQTATCMVPKGWTYQGFYFRLVDGQQSAPLKPEHLTDIRLVANGNALQRWSGEDLDAANRYDGMAPYNWSGQAFNNYIALTCVRNRLKTRAIQEATAIPFGAVNDPNPINTLLIEIDISDTAPVDCSIEGYALVSPMADLGGVPATLKTVRKFYYNPAGAGEYDIADIPRIGSISRLMFAEASGGTHGIKSINIQADAKEMWNRSLYVNNTIIKSFDWRNVQDRFFMVDTTEQGNGTDIWSLNGVMDFRMKLDMTGQKDLVLIVEYLATLGA